MRRPSLLKIIQRRNGVKMEAQNFDHFLILDFEATCEKDVKIDPQEIIEFPVLKICGKTFEEQTVFHEYVRPTKIPLLSAFCTDLTGITQQTVAESDVFESVYTRVNDWIAGQPLGEFIFVTCGDWDLKTMLPHQLGHADIRGAPPQYFSRWINIKKPFNAVMGFYPRHLNAMLEAVGLQFEGRPHSGIDDCRNIARVLRALAQRGHVFQQKY